jgi:superfamily II DNA/RNA helicase
LRNRHLSSTFTNTNINTTQQPTFTMGSLSKRKRDQTEEVVIDEKSATTEVERPTKPAQKQEDEASFVDLGLDPRLLQAIAQQKFAKPTLVQRKAIPLALNGQDVLAKADCGSGKTAAYVLPLLSSILKRKAVCHPDRPSRYPILEDPANINVLRPTLQLSRPP